MSKITWKAGTMEYPLPPVMVSCGTIEKPNIMTAAWTGIINSEPPMTYVSIRPERYSHNIIKESGEFVINLPTTKLLTAVDFCGVKSGKDMNKFKEMKLRAGKCSQVAAPQILESPVSLECKVKNVVSYGSHDMFVAEIVAVNVDDGLVDENGKLCLEKADLVAYVHNGYFTLGRKVGFFGFSVCKSAMIARKKMENVVVEVKEHKLPTKKVFDKKAKPARRDERKRFFKDDRKPFSGRKRSPIKKKS